jgi:hypothetical protein
MIKVASTRRFPGLEFCKLQDSMSACCCSKQTFGSILSDSDGAKQEPPNRASMQDGVFPPPPPCSAGASLTICQCHDYPSSIFIPAKAPSDPPRQKLWSGSWQVASSGSCFHFRGAVNKKNGMSFCHTTFGRSLARFSFRVLITLWFLLTRTLRSKYKSRLNSIAGGYNNQNTMVSIDSQYV